MGMDCFFFCTFVRGSKERVSRSFSILGDEVRMRMGTTSELDTKKYPVGGIQTAVSLYDGLIDGAKVQRSLSRRGKEWVLYDGMSFCFYNLTT